MRPVSLSKVTRARHVARQRCSWCFGCPARWKPGDDSRHMQTLIRGSQAARTRSSFTIRITARTPEVVNRGAMVKNRQLAQGWLPYSVPICVVSAGLERNGMWTLQPYNLSRVQPVLHPLHLPHPSLPRPPSRFGCITRSVSRVPSPRANTAAPNHPCRTPQRPNPPRPRPHVKTTHPPPGLMPPSCSTTTLHPLSPHPVAAPATTPTPAAATDAALTAALPGSCSSSVGSHCHRCSSQGCINFSLQLGPHF